MAPDTRLAAKTVLLNLEPNMTQKLEFTFIPDKTTKNTALECKKYYYKIEKNNRKIMLIF